MSNQPSPIFYGTWGFPVDAPCSGNDTAEPLRRTESAASVSAAGYVDCGECPRISTVCHVHCAKSNGGAS